LEGEERNSMVTKLKSYDTGLEIEDTSNLNLLQNDRKTLDNIDSKDIKQLFVVSNRLPVTLCKNGGWRVAG
jgi:hypothetical protein